MKGREWAVADLHRELPDGSPFRRGSPDDFVRAMKDWRGIDVVYDADRLMFVEQAS